MAIWNNPIDLKALNALQEKSLSSHLGIEFISSTEKTLTAKMEVNEKTKQPYGILHGGASCALAETCGSVASNAVLNRKTHVSVGLSIHTNHIAMAKEGSLFATAKALHLGKKTHIFEVSILDEKERLISMTTLTLMVLERHS